MTADKTTTPERIWAFEDYPGQGAVPRSGMWCDEQSETPEGSPCYIRSDLCASGQVRALTRAAGDESKAGWIVSFDDLQAIRAAAGDWGYGIDLEAVEAIALDVERRILAALTPAPQVEVATPTAQEAVHNLGLATASIDRLKESHEELEKLRGARDVDGYLGTAEDWVKSLIAERDQALAREAAAFEAAVGVLERHRDYGMIGSDGDYLAGEAEVLAHGNSLHYALCDVSALTPADAKSALEAYGREREREGMRMAADKIMDRINNTDFAMNYHAPLTLFCKSILAGMETLK